MIDYASHSSALNRHAIAIVAGEPSGDLLGSLLICALQAGRTDLDFFGITGPRMQALGARSLHPMDTLSVRGYIEALANLRAILAIRKNLKQHCCAIRQACSSVSTRRTSICRWSSIYARPAFLLSISSARRSGHGVRSASKKSAERYRTCC